MKTTTKLSNIKILLWVKIEFMEMLLSLSTTIFPYASERVGLGLTYHGPTLQTRLMYSLTETKSCMAPLKSFSLENGDGQIIEIRDLAPHVMDSLENSPSLGWCFNVV